VVEALDDKPVWADFGKLHKTGNTGITRFFPNPANTLLKSVISQSGLLTRSQGIRRTAESVSKQ
jgi:hypothetical protein